MRIQIFDPRLSHSTGVCGPSVDPAAARFAADVEWLHSQGVAIERFDLARNPGAFTANRTVREAMAQSGRSCLPLVVIGDTIVSWGRYPARETLVQAVAAKERSPASDEASRASRVAGASGCCTRPPAP